MVCVTDEWVFVVDEERTWDLSSIMKETSIESLSNDLDTSLARIQKVLDQLQEKQDDMTASELGRKIEDLEDAVVGIYTIACYSMCKYYLVRILYCYQCICSN